jgi:hypothetical protein
MRGITWTVLACAAAAWAWSGCDNTEAQDGGATATTSSGGGTTGSSTGASSTGGASTTGGGTTGGTTGGSTSGGTSGGTTGGTVQCPVAAPSQCTTPGLAHPGSVVRGVAQLAPGFTPPAGTRGDLVMYLTHEFEGQGAYGGVFHAVDRIPNVDFANGPVPFQIDMCHNDIAMYSEDDCAFNLILILDTNSNNFDPNPNNPQNQVPDIGEAASRQVVSISCQGPSQCVSATLGCADGLSCVAFTDPTTSCVCASQTCNSDYRLCQ